MSCLGDVFSTKEHEELQNKYVGDFGKPGLLRCQFHRCGPVKVGTFRVTDFPKGYSYDT